MKLEHRSIKKLPSELINKIAAGEVVERPSSIVKELIDNSIDAGASQITVEVKNGGLDFIRVSDNGYGMNREDAELALERHTTSKISNYSDLFELNTMGFRGEALASISSVSDFTLETKMVNELGGTKITTNGIISNIETSACNTGTVISIENLFGNVPARKKFLKTPNTEYNHILEIFTQYVIYYHTITWKLINNESVAMQTPRVNHRIDRIKQVLGSEASRDLIDISVKGTIALEGFIGKPKVFKSNKKFQFTYINGRPVHDYVIAKAVQDAFGSLSINRLYPIFILDIKLDPRLVDVNVHPRKTEVKFKDHNEIYRLIKSSVKNSLVQHGVLTSTDLMQSFSSSKSSSYEPVDSSGIVFKPKQVTPRFTSQSLSAPTTNRHKVDTSNITKTLKFSEGIAKIASQQNSILHELDDWKLVGQIHNSFLLVETPKGFLVIDQHAAAERLNYEKLLAEYNSKEKRSQRLLVAQTMELSHREQQLVASASDQLKKLGFEIESFGENTISINSVPQDLFKADVITLIKGIINDLDSEGFEQVHNLEEKQNIVIKYAACRGAIMFNDKLTEIEQIQLLKDIKNLPDDKKTCCHGRPFMKEFLINDLAKLFHRT